LHPCPAPGVMIGPMTDAADPAPFWRHVRACNAVPDEASLLPFRIGARRVGWLRPEAARVLTFFPQLVHFDADGVALARRLRSPPARSAALSELAGALVRAGLAPHLRGELYDVRGEPGGPVLAQLDRGAVPCFGVRAEGVHVNGLVRRADGLHVWVARRARDKAIAPGKLDHIVAGGVPAGLSAEQTLVKEAFEEAAIPPELAGRARKVAEIAYAMQVEDGLRVDLLHCYDLDLPDSFTPRPNDGEVEGFVLMPIDDVFAAVRDTDAFKFNVNLVLIDLFLRERLIDPASPEGRRLAASLARPV
jgi:8-oxo-dGTP pyrophosphatase MutT (NUDIX family)